MLKSQTMLPDATVSGSAVDGEGLKPYWKSEKKPLLGVISKPII